MLIIEVRFLCLLKDIDDEDSNDYLLYKVTRVPKKVQINIGIYKKVINVNVPAI